MRALVLFGVCGVLAWAQSNVTTYTADLVNGGFDTTSSSNSSDHTHTQTTQSINGQSVPLEQHEDRVIRSDANGSVTESIVKRYDATGQLISTDRTVTDLRKLGSGNSTVIATTYHSDVNGSEQVAERNTTDTRVSGSQTTANTTIERADSSWSLQAVEKRSSVTDAQTQGKDQKSTTTESVYRGDPYSGYREAERKVINQSTANGRVVVDTTDYGPGSTNGSLQFQERRVSTTSSAANGDQSTIVDVYAPSADGTVRDPEAAPQIKQEQVIARVKNADGSVVDTFSVREPSVSDPTKLGALTEVTRTVCKGKCDATPAAPAKTPAPAPAPAPAPPAK